MLPSNWYGNSVCNGCEYGERITGGVFCHELQGLVPCGYQGCKAQNDYYDEMYKKEKGMTLTELANELRKIFDFKYLTYDPVFKIRMWKIKPKFRKPVYDYFFGSWRIPRGAATRREAALAETGGFGRSLISPLDLSEYKEKEQLQIDYSKCIVEVE